MEVPRFDREFLYQVTLTTGVGSNPIGLDRGQLGSTKVVSFRRVGPKVLLEEPNYRFRAMSDNPDERKSVEESFARSVVWGFKIEAEEAGRVLVVEALDAFFVFFADRDFAAVLVDEEGDLDEAVAFAEVVEVLREGGLVDRWRLVEDGDGFEGEWRL